MSKKQFIALQAIQYVDENGIRRSVEPRSEKRSGLFEHEFDKKTEKRLFAIGALREPEGTEEHEDETKIETLHDRRDIEGDATVVDPLDHDADGKKGGSKPGGTRKKGAEAPSEDAPAPAAEDGKPSEDLLG